MRADVLRFAWLALLACACSRASEPSPRPDILLITLDTVRADHCSAYGYARPTTPTMERLAAEGVRCEVAYAPMATTGPSHASMFTGLLPRSHGLLTNGYVLARDTPTLAESLRDAGYRTAAFVSSFVLDRRFQLDQGFEQYDDDFSKATSSVPLAVWKGIPVPGHFDRRGDETSARALAWMGESGFLAPRRADAPPTFLWVHLFDPHHPYNPLPEYAAKFPPTENTDLGQKIAAYDAEIRFVDDQVEKIVRALEGAGRLDDTLVVVVADHGEGLGQHGHMQHGLYVYEEAVRVPMVFRWGTRLPRARVVAEPVQLIDLAPTILGLAGVPSGIAKRDGLDLSAFLRGEFRADPSRPVLLQRRLYESELDERVVVKGEKHGVRTGRWKLISAAAENSQELYDLETDPGELVNLYAERPSEAEPLERQLGRWLESPAASSVPPAIDAETEKRLRSLGYVR